MVKGIDVEVVFMLLTVRKVRINHVNNLKQQEIKNHHLDFKVDNKRLVHVNNGVVFRSVNLVIDCEHVRVVQRKQVDY